MSRAVVTVPYAAMRMSQVNWWIDWRGRSAERNDDTTQTVYNRAPIWRGAASLVLPGADAGPWRARHWTAEGRSAVYRLFMVDPLIFDRQPLLSAAARELGVPFAGGNYFSTGTGFEPGPYVGAAAPAAPGDPTIEIETDAAALVPVVGQIISAGDWPMGVTSVEALGGDRYRLGVALQRATIAAGDPIALVATGLFEIAADDASSMPYGLSRVARPDLTVREALKR